MRGQDPIGQMYNDTRHNAHGKWLAILSALGFSERVLSGKHGPCPMCEGTDRFRFTNYQDNGDYFCSGCGAGSGFDLIMKTNGWNFSDTAKEVDKIIGIGNIEPVFKPEINVEKRRSELNKVWRDAQAPSVLDSYLESRGIKKTPLAYLADVRGHDSLPLAIGHPATGPAMVALIRNVKGCPVSIHRTYINVCREGEKKRKMMPPTEKITGAGIHLGTQEGDTLVIGEGIETTLSGMEYFHGPGIAAISAWGMESLVIRGVFEHVIILGDNDDSFTGQKAAFTLARRLDNQGRDVRVVIPTGRGRDFNDFDEGMRSFLSWDNGRS